MNIRFVLLVYILFQRIVSQMLLEAVQQDIVVMALVLP